MSNSSGSAPKTSIPQVVTPFVDPRGIITDPWLRLLVSLWKTSGGSQVSPATGAYLQVATDGSIDVYSSTSFKKIGSILFVPVQGGAEAPQALGASPFEFLAVGLGNLLVSSGKVEFSRAGGPWRQIGLLGGYFFLEPKDSVRVSWYGVSAPEVVWFPFA